MKRVIAIVLSCALLASTLSGCTSENKQTSSVETSVENNVDVAAQVDESTTQNSEKVDEISETEKIDETVAEVVDEFEEDDWEDEELEFKSLDDPQLLQYIEDSVYTGLVEEFDSEDYIIEEVSVIYLSNEYLEEVAYNSKANIWFGHTLEELDEQFEGQSYVFTLGEDGTTVVEPFEDYDDTYEKVIKNVAIGTGVILICVTVSVVTGGLGAAPVSMVFAASAKTATTMALSSAAFSSIFAAAVTGYQTKDFDEAMKAAMLQGSEGYKWGAITGAVTGGLSKANELRKAAKAAKDLEAFEASIQGLEGWQQAEARALYQYGGKDQVSYLAGKEVPFGTQGATRPDVVREVGGHLEAIEVKYYDLASKSSRGELYRELEREITARIANMPEGTTQRVVLDVTGREFSEELITMVQNNIWKRLADVYPNIPIDIVGL